jgi:diacylglycerol kinase
MRYLFAFLVPPLAVAMCGRWVHFAFNLIVWLISIPLIFFVGLGLIGWLLCTIHALVVCKMASVDKRVDRIVNAIQTERSSPSNAK